MVTKISDLSSAQVATVLQVAHKMKANPKDYYDALPNETLLMLFEKPSLRTRVSLEVGMTELGGHAISFMTGDSPLGKKETYGDTGACLSRYVTAITARVTSREQINGLCATASVPVAGRHARSRRSCRPRRRRSRRGRSRRGRSRRCRPRSPHGDMVRARSLCTPISPAARGPNAPRLARTGRRVAIEPLLSARHLILASRTPDRRFRTFTLPYRAGGRACCGWRSRLAECRSRAPRIVPGGLGSAEKRAHGCAPLRHAIGEKKVSCSRVRVLVCVLL